MKVSIAIAIFVIFKFVNCNESVTENKVQFEGCEKESEFNTSLPLQCCKSYAALLSMKHMQCGKVCATFHGQLEHRCCWANCTFALDKILDANGVVDNELLIAYLNGRFVKQPEWTEPIKKSVEECTKEGPEIAAKFKEKLGGEVKSEAEQNFGMKHCIMRNLFFNCPKKVESQECTNYEEFGKSCLLFPQPPEHKKPSKETKKKTEE